MSLCWHLLNIHTSGYQILDEICGRYNYSFSECNKETSLLNVILIAIVLDVGMSTLPRVQTSSITMATRINSTVLRSMKSDYKICEIKS